jgi:hypothetical protein
MVWLTSVLDLPNKVLNATAIVRKIPAKAKKKGIADARLKLMCRGKTHQIILKYEIPPKIQTSNINKNSAQGN